MSDSPTAATVPGLGAYAARYWAALLGMFKPRFLFKALWHSLTRRLFITLFVAPFIYGLAAGWHIYLQAKAGGWNDAPGELLQPGNYAEAGARWFAMAMFLFGIYGFARGTGFRIVKTTFGALGAAPSGLGFAVDSFRRHIGESLLYERLLLGGGVAALAGEIVMRIHWPWHKFLLLAAAIALLGALKLARNQKNASRGRSAPPLAAQLWLFVAGIAGGLLLTWLGFGKYSLLAIGLGIFLFYRRTHPPKSGGGAGTQAGSAALLLLILSGFFLMTTAVWSDDGGWDEYYPESGGEKTVIGYLNTKDGRKVIELGAIAGGFATAGAVIGILLGGALGEAFANSLKATPPVQGEEGEAPPPLPGQDGDWEGDGWEVTDDDGKVHVFRTEKEANEFYDDLLRRDRAEETENTEGWYKNAVEQIGFLESVRRGLAKAGMDTTAQDREIARWKEERDRLANQVRKLGGSTSYTARRRSDWTFGENDEMVRRQKEKSDLLRDIQKTGKAARNLANKGNISYGEGQTDNIIDRTKEWSENLVSGKGKQPTRKDLERLKNILRHEMGAADAREESRNTNWVKEGMQGTSREIFTGVGPDGGTSYKSMVFRGLIGAATGGQSEYVMEVTEKMYVVHDEVQKGKSGMDAFKTAVKRVVTDEITGRVVEGGIKVGGKAGSAGYGHFVEGTRIGDTLSEGAKKAKNFLDQDVGDMLRGGGKEAGESVGRTAVRPRPEIESGTPKSDVLEGGAKAPELDEHSIRRKEAFERGREAGKQKVDRLNDAIENHRNNPDSPQAKKDLQDAVDAVQQDKHAMQDMNRRGQDPASQQVRKEFNKELQTSYEQAHHSTRQRIADEYGVPVEDVKIVKPTNKPGVGGEIEAADPRGFAKKPDPDFKTHPDDYPQSRPEGEVDASGKKASFDQDITYRVKQDKVIDPRTGEVTSGHVDVPKATTQRVYDQEFYKARHNGELPTVRNPDGSVKLDAGGKPVIDDAAVHDYSKKMDQACTDRLDAEAYGNGDADLQTAVKGDYKGRDFDDVEGVGKTMEHKQYEWRNEAHECSEKAKGLRTEADDLRAKGDIDGADRATRQADELESHAEGLTEEGYRQTTKQYGNQLEARVDAANQQEFFKHQNNGELPMKQNPNTGRMEVDMDKVRQTQQDFYKAENGELPVVRNPDGTPKLDAGGNPEVDMKEVTRYTTEQGKASGMHTAQIPPKLTEAVDIMKKTGEPGFSPAEVEQQLRKIGYTPEKVTQQMSSNLEALQKFKGATGPGIPDVTSPGIGGADGGFDLGGAAKGALEGIKKPLGREILGGDSS